MFQELFVPGLALSLIANVAACSFTNDEPEWVTPAVRAPLRTALDDRACPDEDQDTADARRAIARARAMVALPPMRCDAAASGAAAGHCRYLITNGELTHFQTTGRPAFTAVTFEARLALQRFSELPAGEVIANITGAAAVEGPRGFLNSVYHRAPFLRTESSSFGYGHIDACATIDFGRKTEDARAPERVVVWPPDGSKNVPAVFYAAAERPNPVPGRSLVGYPVSLIRESALVALSAEIQGPAGVLDAVLVTAKTDPEHLVRPGEAHLVPTAPLLPYTEYRVRFSFRSKGEEEAIQTSFITGGE